MADSGLPCFGYKEPLKALQQRFHMEMTDVEAARFMRDTVNDAYDKVCCPVETKSMRMCIMDASHSGPLDFTTWCSTCSKAFPSECPLGARPTGGDNISVQNSVVLQRTHQFHVGT